ncbi:LuxR C-terminal-related transcriptional regulator [Cryptosporangium aurantiacum]|uniref:LuxR family transcriptional regulator, maltose regulon positive regulatory protein n=1 Tax=Cryptosporangium aurantiacum TaxID=134849 RepID=A0A1M7RFX6_9ACTN|nr:LuxR C-terminal-related transcriptional regulator [Cryptosporangium aurantiacum]SHN45096.1 LuxR family transcriptional regulator, maltose regulon positive regulatory protein [Cryptosporangium aurantiacum]
MSDPVAVPRPPPHHLVRPRLTELLGRRPLTTVVAEAGAGKTALVADWALTGPVAGPVAWLTVDADADPPDWASVVAALRPTVPALPVGADPNPAELAAALAARGSPVVLVVDGADRIPDPVGIGLDRLVRAAPDAVRLILLGRTAPPLPTYRYRLSGDLTTIDGRDLALRLDEMSALLGRYGVRVSAAEADALYRRTEGWATGVCLHASAVHRGLETTHRLCGEYLRAEVLADLPPALQDLLQRLSVLDVVEVRLAEWLTARYGVRATLEELVARNAFVRPAGDDTYRIHPLLRDVLADDLAARHPSAVAALHKGAAFWYAERHRPAEAVAHAARIDEWQYAAELAVDQLGVGWLVGTLDEAGPGAVLSELPAQTPGGAAAVVRAAIALGRHDLGAAGTAAANAAVLVDERSAPHRSALAAVDLLLARRTGDVVAAQDAAMRLDLLAVAHGPDDALADDRTRSLLLANLGAAQLWTGDLGGARRMLERAARAGTGHGVHDAEGQLALLELAEGSLGRAERQAAGALSAADAAGVRPVARLGAASVALAIIAFEHHDLATARAHLPRALTAVDARHDPTTALALVLLRAGASTARGDGKQALAVLAGFRALAAGWRANPEAEHRIDLASARAHLTLGHLDKARRLVAAVPESPCRTLVHGRLLLLTGEFGRAADLLAGTHAQDLGTDAGVRLALLRAEVAFLTGAIDAAERGVAEALAEARVDERRRPFVDAGPWLRQLIDRQPALADPYARLFRAPAEPSAVRDADPQPEITVPLTARETEVVSRLAQGLSTTDIARELNLSVNTVKSHLKSVYRKLGTSDRSATSRRARELHLVDDVADGRSGFTPAG